MQSLQLANDELNNVHFNLAEVTAKQEEEKEGEKLCNTSSNNDKILSVHELLKDILKEIRKTPRVPSIHSFPIHVKPRLDLLEKLVEKVKLNMVVVTLHPIAQGYNIALRASDGTVVQDSHQDYVHESFLNYLNKEELPPQMADDWEQMFPELFYRGCVIVEIKDCRVANSKPYIYHLLLKPHSESVMNDVMCLLTEEGIQWTKEEKLGVERAIVNSMQPPLCLDPNPKIGFRRIKAFNEENVFNTEDLNVVVARASEFHTTRKRKYDLLASHEPSFDLISKPKAKRHVPVPVVQEPDPLKLKEQTIKDLKRLVKPYKDANETVKSEISIVAESSNNAAQLSGQCLLDGTLNGLYNDFLTSPGQQLEPKMSLCRDQKQQLLEANNLSMHNLSKQQSHISQIEVNPEITALALHFRNSEQQYQQQVAAAAAAAAATGANTSNGTVNSEMCPSDISPFVNNADSAISNLPNNCKKSLSNNFSNCSNRLTLPIANQLSSSTVTGAQQEMNIARNNLAVSNLHPTFTPHFQTIRNNNKTTLKSSNTRHFSASQSLPNVPTVQAIHMISGSKENPSNPMNQNVGSNLNRQIPGLSALLADIEGDA